MVHAPVTGESRGPRWYRCRRQYWNLKIRLRVGQYGIRDRGHMECAGRFGKIGKGDGRHALASGNSACGTATIGVSATSSVPVCVSGTDTDSASGMVSGGGTRFGNW